MPSCGGQSQWLQLQSCPDLHLREHRGRGADDESEGEQRGMWKGWKGETLRERVVIKLHSQKARDISRDVELRRENLPE